MTRPYSTTVTAGDDILADQYNNLRTDTFYHFQQTFMGTSLAGTLIYLGFMGTDHYVYSHVQARIIYRFAIYPGGLFLSPAVTGNNRWADLTGSYKASGPGIAVFGGYVYVWLQRTADDVWVLVRIAESNGNVDEMTISGDAPDQDYNNTVSNDGNDLYILDNVTTKLRKYSVSGTTATHVADITLSETAARFFLVDSERGEIYYQINDSLVLVKDTIAGVQIKKEYVFHQKTSNAMGYIGNVAYVSFYRYETTPLTFILQPLYF